MHWTETLNGYPDELATIESTMAKDGSTFTGSYVYKNGSGGTIKATRQGVQPTASLAVAVSSSSDKVASGKTVKVTATVTARGGDVSGVSLGSGLVSSEALALVTSSPPGLSGFSLTDGQSRSFKFDVKGVKAGTATLTVLADGKTSSGAKVQGSNSLRLTVSGSVLVVTVTPNPGTLRLDLKGKTLEPKTVSVRV